MIKWYKYKINVTQEGYGNSDREIDLLLENVMENQNFNEIESIFEIYDDSRTSSFCNSIRLFRCTNYRSTKRRTAR